MDFVDEMTDIINNLASDGELKIKYGGWINIITADNFKSDVYFYKLNKIKGKPLSFNEYYDLVRKIYYNLEYIGSRLNIVFNFFAYDKLKPYIAFGVGDDIMHDRDILYISNILHNVGFSGDIAIVDVIRNIGYNVIINR